MIGLLAPDRRDRVRAIRKLDARPELAFALRRVLFADRDAVVRAAAARRLGELDGAEPWLLDALGDRSPLVRDAIVRSLSRCERAGGANEVHDRAAARRPLRALVRHDRMWWVRRAAVYALAAIAGTDELPALQAALADPFWRVRHAAVKVLAVLGARDLDVRAVLTAVPESNALTFLRATWGPVAIEAPVRAARATSSLPAPLLDPDPAVVTARLAADTDVSPLALVELLCDPHAPLRMLAAHRVADSGDPHAYHAALDWLEEPRIPHVADTVERMLDELGDPAIGLATTALGNQRGKTIDRVRQRSGAARWAIRWVVATRFEALYPAVFTCAAAEPALRGHAIPIAPAPLLVAWAHEDLVDAVAGELHMRRAFAELLALDASAHPAARALQVDAAARTGCWERVEPALADPHYGPRAVAVRWLVRDRRIDPRPYAADRDPSIREAALCPNTARELVGDVDPWVARAAIEVLAAVGEDAGAVTAQALGARDPWIRARACSLPIGDADLPAVLACIADPEPMVRSAALDALGRAPAIDERLGALLAGPAQADLVRTLAHAWLARALDDAAIERARDAIATEPSPRARRLLAAVVGLAARPGDAARDEVVVHDGAAPDDAARDQVMVYDGAAPDDAARVERRAFGRAGFAVAPLAISGAYDLHPGVLAEAVDAGVDTFFWEPSYDALTRFLRRRRSLHVIAGSYHAEPDAIAADVDLALRRLRRDTIDCFLLFWSRSPARVDAAAFAMLDAIKRTGKVRAIGFSTHHRDLARSALEASPWDAVMIRHSAAHPGIETELLPTARRHGTAIVAFSALCYGRMVSGEGAPSPADCYRYSLAQPGVTACISAPRRRRELVENVAVLAQPMLAPEAIARLREHGVGVRAENQRFNTLMRQPTRDAAAAARELLAAELPPADEIAVRPLPRPSGRRATKTGLGSRRGRR